MCAVVLVVVMLFVRLFVFFFGCLVVWLFVRLFVCWCGCGCVTWSSVVCSLFVFVGWYLVFGFCFDWWALFVFRCLGKAAALKLRFGSGFTFTVSIGSSLDNEIEQRAMHEYVLSMFPSALLLSEPIAGTSQYEIHRSEVVLSDVFARMEDEAVVEKYSITDWAITETTLDECFLKVSGGSTCCCCWCCCCCC
jgi:hypothetical protein